MEEEVVMSKAEIDTTAPFRSVKEAVMLFGETVVLGTQIHDFEYKNEIARSNELDEAKQILGRAREESIQMATSIIFLEQELDQAKIELQRLKDHESNRDEQKKKYVKFADLRAPAEPGLRRQASLRKKKMKELMIPLIKRIFLRKQENSEISFA